MPLDPRTLGAALNENLTLHSTLCRRETAAFQKALQSGEDVVVACTQEKRLFSALAQQTEGVTSVVKFVNIRETGGWSKDASSAMPKIAALLAAARLPDPEPVATVTYKSGGRLLIVGELDQAEQVAALVADVLDVTIFSQGVSPGAASAPPDQERKYPVISGSALQLNGWLGAFELTWKRDNPIDLDLCTRCNACLAACPEGAIGLDYQVDMNRCKPTQSACVTACAAAGAIDFSRPAQTLNERFDLVLDLGLKPLVTLHAPPQGYFSWGAAGKDAQVSIEQGANDGSMRLNPMRLNRYIVNAGVCSKIEADALIVSGAVSINGIMVNELGTKVGLTDKVTVGNESIKHEQIDVQKLPVSKAQLKTNTVYQTARGSAKWNGSAFESLN